MNFKLQEILTEVAKEEGLSFEQVKQIFESEFKSVREIMKEGEKDNPESFKNINIFGLGKIYCKKGVVIKMMKNKNKKKDV